MAKMGGEANDKGRDGGFPMIQNTFTLHKKAGTYMQRERRVVVVRVQVIVAVVEWSCMVVRENV